MKNEEVKNVISRYKKRLSEEYSNRYSLLNSSALYAYQERQRKLIRLLKNNTNLPFSKISLLEVGCGNGVNLLELLMLGFKPENIFGNELLQERVSLARKVLPDSTQIISGDANTLEFSYEKFDIVYQSTVFSSLLDDNFQEALSSKMWSWVKPGGAILWYDFIYNNPSNPDVRGVTKKRIRKLFPEGNIRSESVTLAPPISRIVCKLHPSLYSVFNIFPFLRTHVWCWIQKPEKS